MVIALSCPVRSSLSTRIALQVSHLETVVGSSRPPTISNDAKHGIDIVLGAQWGDEGKGKLVDVLSEVRTQNIVS